MGQTDYIIIIKRLGSVFLSHPVKISPTEGCRKTRRHSEPYKHIRKYSLEPSTSLEDGPRHTHTHTPTLVFDLNWTWFVGLSQCLCCSFPHVSFDDVVGVVHDVSSQSEITDLGHSTVGEENVSGRHISVNALWRFTVNPSDQLITWRCSVRFFFFASIVYERNFLQIFEQISSFMRLLVVFYFYLRDSHS